MTNNKKAYAKPKMACPYCSTEMSVNGLSAHIRFKHPSMAEDWKENREDYISKNIIKDDEPEPEVIESIDEPEAAKIEVEVEAVDSNSEKDDKFLEEPEREEFEIKQVKNKSKSKPRVEPKTEKRRYGFFGHR